MGGHLQVRSQAGVGSIFWFDLDLPVSVEWSKAAKMTDRGTITGYEGDRKTILVADDKWENRSVLKSLLEPLGFAILTAEDGQDALNRATQQPPHLFIIDLDMPILDGLALIQRIRQSPTLQTIPVAVSSASVFDTDQHRCLEAGADSFLPKPVDATELFEQLETLLGLTWIYDQASSSSAIAAPRSPAAARGTPTAGAIVPPDAAVLAELHDLALRGNLRAILQQVKTLSQTDPTLAPFADKVCSLAQRFQEQQLIALIAQYREETSL